jgi:8-oxo-dGTP pyrophosphatase MutT (NUDIX family)
VAGPPRSGPIRPWRRLAARRLAECRVFDVDRVRYAPPDGSTPRDFFIVEAPDWINVIPITPDGHVVFVRQFRFGIDAITLEIPGGMCDPGEDPRTAARRELREETGYDGGELVDLGWVHPNPAVQTNRCHTFLAKDARRVGAPQPDGDEAFEILTVPLQDVPGLIRDGSITHALVIAAFYKLGR